MPNHEFKALVLDLFDTLVKWEPDRLPVMEFKGREMHSTMPWVLPKLAERLGDAFDQDSFIEIYNEVNTAVAVERDSGGIEITCHERFARTLTRIVPAGEHEIRTFAEHLTRVHMAGVRSVTWAPAERVAAVKAVAPHYRLGLLSNFDDAQSGREVLRDTGVAHLFEAVIISAEVGLRKPNPKIYQRMLEMLRLEPRDVLFVGDTPREDVLGPRQAGMRTAWVSKGAPSIPEGIPAPDFIIKDLSELPLILEI
jgi:HAD superfamily hydrolase (TIGR01549 family)